jgi:hypothetical protein
MIGLQDLRGLAVLETANIAIKKKPKACLVGFWKSNTCEEHVCRRFESDNLHSRSPLLAKPVNEGGRLHAEQMPMSSCILTS